MEDFQYEPPAYAPSAVELLDHYGLASTPEVTLSALQVFFPGKAREYFEALKVGQAVRVEDPEYVLLVGQLAAQGFRVRLVA